MDSTTVTNLPDSVKVFIIMIGLWFFNQWWQDRKDKDKSQSEALNKNTLAVVELQVQIKNLSELLSILPRIREDLNSAHEKIRELNGQAKDHA